MSANDVYLYLLGGEANTCDAKAAGLYEARVRAGRGTRHMRVTLEECRQAIRVL
jgi:hypothetical protein